MFVIEGVGDHIYSMCALTKDLKVKDVKIVAKTAKERDSTSYAMETGEKMHIDEGEWWMRIALRNLHSTDQPPVPLEFLIQDSTQEYTILDAKY